MIRKVDPGLHRHCPVLDQRGASDHAVGTTGVGPEEGWLTILDIVGGFRYTSAVAVSDTGPSPVRR